MIQVCNQDFRTQQEKASVAGNHKGTHTLNLLILTWQGRDHDQAGVFPGQGSSLALQCADPCDFPKCGKLDCIICGSEGLRSHSPLILATDDFSWS